MTNRSSKSSRLTATALSATMSAVIALSLPLASAPAFAGTTAPIQRNLDQRREAQQAPQPRVERSNSGGDNRGSDNRGSQGSDRGGDRGGSRGGGESRGGNDNRGSNAGSPNRGNDNRGNGGGWNRQPGQDNAANRPDRNPGNNGGNTGGNWQNRPDRNDGRPDNRPDNRPGNGNDNRGNDGRWNGGNTNNGGWTGNRGNDNRGNDNRGGWDGNRGNDNRGNDWGRNDRNDRDRGGWDRDRGGDRGGWSSRHSYNWRSHRDFRSYTGVRIGFYFAPRYGYYQVPSQYYGYRYDYGDLLPRYFYSYRVYDPDFYFLPPKPYGCEYYFVGNDIALVDLRTGRIIDIFYDVF